MPDRSTCQTRLDLTNQMEILRKRVADVISAIWPDLKDCENALDRRSLLFECRVITEHRQRVERELVEHIRLHGCGTTRPKCGPRLRRR